MLLLWRKDNVIKALSLFRRKLFFLLLLELPLPGRSHKYVENQRIVLQIDLPPKLLLSHCALFLYGLDAFKHPLVPQVVYFLPLEGQHALAKSSSVLEFVQGTLIVVV